MLDPTNLIGSRVPRLASRFFPDLLWRRSLLNHDDRVAYLSFDDGPNDAVTPRLLDVLDRFEAKAAFFLVGRQAEEHPQLVHRLHEAGHTIGNHTFSHPDAWRHEAPDVLREMDRTTALLHDLTGGEAVRWMRPPYGRFTSPMRRWCLARQQRLTMWDVMPGDFLGWATPERVARRIVKLIRPGSIIALHDQPSTRDVTPAALKIALKRLTKEGWHFPAL